MPSNLLSIPVATLLRLVEVENPAAKTLMPGHLLLTLINQPKSRLAILIENAGGDADKFRSYITSRINQWPLHATIPEGYIPRRNVKLNNVFVKAQTIRQRTSDFYATIECLLIALIELPETYMVASLAAAGISPGQFQKSLVEERAGRVIDDPGEKYEQYPTIREGMLLSELSSF
jgi:ATP-dependent Clp protease ATP-binding subunit ClpA